MFAAIYLPNFYLQAVLRHQSELSTKPVALLNEEDAKPVILQLNQNAISAGVCKGMTPSQGLARSLNLILRVRSRTQEKLLNEILLHHAFILGPYVEATAPGICTVEFTDNRNLTDKVSRVIEQLSDAEVVAKAGIASTPDTSLLAAHLAKSVLHIDEPGKFLAPLPIETLDLVPML
jgi:hypothetical protein